MQVFRGKDGAGPGMCLSFPLDLPVAAIADYLGRAIS